MSTADALSRVCRSVTAGMSSHCAVRDADGYAGEVPAKISMDVCEPRADRELSQPLMLESCSKLRISPAGVFSLPVPCLA